MISRVLFFVAICLLAGCVGKQERPSTVACRELPTNSSACRNSSFITLADAENGGDSTIGFVEFNDEGLPFDQANVDGVLNNIKNLNSANDQSLLMVMFIHGWNHNAAQSDGNVIQFKSFLRSLQKQEKALTVGKPRTVVGLYVGWQGKSSDSQIASLFSYRQKKELGLKTGEDSVTNILQSLSEIKALDRNNRLVLVGHSFGGGVLFSAVKSDLLKRFNDPDPQSVKLFGDLVVLVNPAIEAARFVEIHKALDRKFPVCTPLSLVSFTSEADTALSKDFPLGMQLFYADKLRGDASDDLLTTAYGRYSAFSKYELRPESGITVPQILTKTDFDAAIPTWGSFRSTPSPFVIGGIHLSHSLHEPVNPWEPILNVLVDKSLVQEHNEIWDPQFQYFLRGLIGMEFAKARQCR